MEDLTLEDLNRIREWYLIFVSVTEGTAGESVKPEDHALYGRITERTDHLEELADLEQDDCLGGACKL